jgi:hypothetical protein
MARMTPGRQLSLVSMDKVFTSGYQLANLSLQTHAVSPTIELDPSYVLMGTPIHDVRRFERWV